MLPAGLWHGGVGVGLGAAVPVGSGVRVKGIVAVGAGVADGCSWGVNPEEGGVPAQADSISNPRSRPKLRLIPATAKACRGGGRRIGESFRMGVERRPSADRFAGICSLDGGFVERCG